MPREEVVSGLKLHNSYLTIARVGASASPPYGEGWWSLLTIQQNISRAPTKCQAAYARHWRYKDKQMESCPQLAHMVMVELR